MAAGMGSRYGGLKQIDPVGNHGQLIIDYSIYDAKRAGFDTVVFVIKHEIEEAFHEAIGDRLSKFINVKYAYQQLDDLPEGYEVPDGRVKPWGTCHAVLAARKVVDGPFAVVNADDYYGPEGFREIYQYLESHPDSENCYEFAMVGYLLGNTVTEYGHVARGICEEDENNYLVKVTEHTHIEKMGDDARFTESFLKEAEARFPKFLDNAIKTNPLKGEYFLPSVVTQLLEEGKARVKVLRSADKWYGVTYKEDKPCVVAAIAEKTASGLYPDKLWEV